MSRFVRSSHYRHVYGQSTKKENCYDNIRVSASAWDTNLATVNTKYLAVNYQASGGGAFLVCPLSHTGKLPDLYPLCRAHTAPVLDTAFSPFDDELIASSGEDGKVVLTRINESRLLSALRPKDPEVTDLEPIMRLPGHGRKAGHVRWHPTAQGVLVSAGLDIKIWDVEKGTAALEMPQQPDMVQSMSFNWTGTLLATTCKDKKLKLFDLRSGQIAQMADSHTGIKGSRVEWMGRLDRICTTGFSKFSDRQVFVWNSGDISKGPVKQLTVDTSSGTLMPFWSDNDILFLAGKGDGNIRYYEYEADDLFYLTEYRASEPQRGMCWLPRRGLNTADCEIARAFKVTNSMVEPIPFIVPRKSDSFQSDIYPPAPSSQPALSASEFFSGKTAEPILVDLENQQATAPPPIKGNVYAAAPPPSAPTRQASPPPREPSPAPIPPPARTPSPVPRMSDSAASRPNRDSGSPSEEVAALRKENEELKEELAERDYKIRNLELQLEKLRTNKRKIVELAGLTTQG